MPNSPLVAACGINCFVENVKATYGSGDADPIRMQAKVRISWSLFVRFVALQSSYNGNRGCSTDEARVPCTVLV